MPHRDHRQRGEKLGRCQVCDRWVWSNQGSRIVSVAPLVFAHRTC